jgi:Fe-S cluster assembly protein SufD
MSQAVKEKSIYADAFREFAGRREGEPAWLGRMREGAFGRFEELGFPTTDEEDWKYTNVAPLARKAFRRVPEGEVELDSAAAEPFISAEARQSRLVFVNGVYSPQHSLHQAIPAHVTLVDLGVALADEETLRGDEPEVLWNHLGRLSGEGSDAFSALNTAFVDGGLLLRVPAGVALESPVQLLFLTAPGETGGVTFPRVLVVAERDSRLDIIETHAAAGDGEYFTDAVVEVFVGEGARVTHYKVQDEAAAAYHIASTRAEVSKDGAYELTTVTLGARLSRHEIEVALTSPGASCRVDGLYIVGDGQHADTHSLIEHREPNCASRQNYKGILDGKSRAVFNGRVYVHEGARGTDAQQSNKNLLLSTEARVDTKPQLEIYNDDVKCAHGATVGQLEEEELFYLLSRGLHPDLARNLLTYGFAEEIIGNIKHESIRAQLDEAILNRLHARLEA